jgi:hypothetical protein
VKVAAPKTSKAVAPKAVAPGKKTAASKAAKNSTPRAAAGNKKAQHKA